MKLAESRVEDNCFLGEDYCAAEMESPAGAQPLFALNTAKLSCLMQVNLL